MASILILGALCFLARKGRAGVIEHSGYASRNCQSFTIPVNVSAVNADYRIQRVDNDIEATAYAIHADTWITPPGPLAAISNITIEGVYNISAQLCIPGASNTTNDKADILQLATHGLHYDGRYWDPQFDSGAYSYVNAATEAGYSILTYDRLGMSGSDKPDAYTVVQAPVHFAILHQFTLMARDGTIYDIAKRSASGRTTFQNLTAPSKIIHVGHSFGSVTTLAYISQHGAQSDGAIITGYIPNEKLGAPGAISFGLQYAATYLPEYADRGSGYAVANEQGIQAVFFGGNVSTAFTPEMLEYGNKIKQPLTVGEYTSAWFVALAGTGSTDFEGPVQYLLPEFDFYVCDGDCKGVYDEEAVGALFPNATDFEVYIQPNTGHALPLHNNATAGYQVTFDFLARNGL